VGFDQRIIWRRFIKTQYLVVVSLVVDKARKGGALPAKRFFPASTS
jgi:hypothetical protein